MPLPGDQVRRGQDYLTTRITALETQLREPAAASSRGSAVLIPMYPKVWPSTSLDTANQSLTIPASAATNVIWEAYIPEITRPVLWVSMISGRVTGTSAVPTYTVELARDTIEPVTLGSWSQTGFYRTVRGPYDLSPYLGQARQLTIALSATGTGTDRVAVQMRQCWMQ